MQIPVFALSVLFVVNAINLNVNSGFVVVALTIANLGIAVFIFSIKKNEKNKKAPSGACVKSAQNKLHVAVN